MIKARTTTATNALPAIVESPFNCMICLFFSTEGAMSKQIDVTVASVVTPTDIIIIAWTAFFQPK